MLERIRNNWKTTIAGVIVAVVSILGAVGILSPDQSEALNTGSSGILTHIEGIVGIVAGILLTFARD